MNKGFLYDATHVRIEVTDANTITLIYKIYHCKYEQGPTIANSDFSHAHLHRKLSTTHSIQQRLQ